MPGPNFVFPPPPPPPPLSLVTTDKQKFSTRAGPANSIRSNHGSLHGNVRGRGRTTSFRSQGIGLRQPESTYRPQPLKNNMRGTRVAQITSQSYCNSPGTSSVEPSQASSFIHGPQKIYAKAFAAGKQGLSRTAVAPAVPSFGSPIPITPALVTDHFAGNSEMKLQYNQLGLTPKSDEFESCGEEDLDEESTLATDLRAPTNGTLLQFSYQGKVSSLHSPAEIIAWVEERKRKYPTKARQEDLAAKTKKRQEQVGATTREVVENLKVKDNTRAAANDDPSELRKVTEYKTAFGRRVAPPGGMCVTNTERVRRRVREDLDALDEAHEAQQRVTRLRRKLKGTMQEPVATDVQIAANGTNVSGCLQPMKSDSLSSHSSTDSMRSNLERSPEELRRGAPNVIAPRRANLDGDRLPASNLICNSDTSFVESGVEDNVTEETSTSGSSDEEPDDSMPMEMSSEPSRNHRGTNEYSSVRPKPVCRLSMENIYRHNCDRSQYLHKQDNTNLTRVLYPKSQRTNLYQKLLARQQEDDDERSLHHIVEFGENDLLDEASPKGTNKA